MMWVQMSGCISSMEQVTDIGGGLLECGSVWRWGSPDVSSVRCNSIPLLQTYFQEVLSSGVGVEVRQEERMVLEDERQGWFVEFTQLGYGAQSSAGVGSAYSAQRRV